MNTITLYGSYASCITATSKAQNKHHMHSSKLICAILSIIRILKSVSYINLFFRFTAPTVNCSFRESEPYAHNECMNMTNQFQTLIISLWYIRETYVYTTVITTTISAFHIAC